MPEQASREFTEKLIMLPESYLPADHANLVGSVLTRPRASSSDVNHTAAFAFGSLSSFQKLDSSVFDVWANILRRSSQRSVLRLMRYALHDLAEPRLREELAARVHPSRLSSAHGAWLDHSGGRLIWCDVGLYKVGPWGRTAAGRVPSVSLAGNRMEARAGVTALRAARLSAYTEASLKDYEVSRLEKACEIGSGALVTEEAPDRAPLFDTKDGLVRSLRTT